MLIACLLLMTLMSVIHSMFYHSMFYDLVAVYVGRYAIIA